MGTAHTLIKVKPQTRQALTDPNPVDGTGPVALWHLAGHSPGGRGLEAGAGGCGRAWRMHSPYLAEQVGQDNVWQRAGEAGELQREHRELLHCRGCLLPQEAARTGRRGRGLPTLAAAQSIQPLPLGSMFIRTSPSTRSGKMSCREQEGRGSEGRGDVPWAAPHQSHCTGIAQS